MVRAQAENHARTIQAKIASDTLLLSDQVKAEAQANIAAAEIIAERAEAAQQQIERVEEKIRNTIVTAGSTQSKIDELFTRHGVDPAEELMKMATATTPNGFQLTTEQRIQVWSKLIEYKYPKLSVMKTAAHIDHSVTVVVRKTLSRHGASAREIGVVKRADAEEVVSG